MKWRVLLYRVKLLLCYGVLLTALLFALGASGDGVEEFFGFGVLFVLVLGSYGFTFKRTNNRVEDLRSIQETLSRLDERVCRIDGRVDRIYDKLINGGKNASRGGS